MERYICIHGHFYQPPRENPWLEAIELQDSAYPYHDWNERITAECYAPNSVARIVDNDNRIIKLINNYARISFNFGPTLLSWLEAKAPDVYGAILEADRESQQRFSGHGSALAQVYNHAIMPLANSRDRKTQILWGIGDFTKRFRRAPEGMWLAETAVDVETLELLAAQDIQFVILAPHQAARVRADRRTPMESDRRRRHRSQPSLPPSATLRTRPSRYFSTTGRSPARSPSKACYPTATALSTNSWAALPMTAIGPSWSISPPMAKVMAIIIGLVTWRWPTHWIESKPNSWRA